MQNTINGQKRANAKDSAVLVDPSSSLKKNQTRSEAGNGSNSSPSIPLAAVNTPTSGGAISSIGEKFTTEKATGTAKLAVPIATTNINGSRGSMVPSLGLSYNSGSGNGTFRVWLADGSG